MKHMKRILLGLVLSLAGAVFLPGCYTTFLMTIPDSDYEEDGEIQVEAVPVYHPPVVDVYDWHRPRPVFGAWSWDWYHRVWIAEPEWGISVGWSCAVPWWVWENPWSHPWGHRRDGWRHPRPYHEWMAGPWFVHTPAHFCVEYNVFPGAAWEMRPGPGRPALRPRTFATRQSIAPRHDEIRDRGGNRTNASNRRTFVADRTALSGVRDSRTTGISSAGSRDRRTGSRTEWIETDERPRSRPETVRRRDDRAFSDPAPAVRGSDRNDGDAENIRIDAATRRERSPQAPDRGPQPPERNSGTPDRRSGAPDRNNESVVRIVPEEKIRNGDETPMRVVPDAAMRREPERFNADRTPANIDRGGSRMDAPVRPRQDRRRMEETRRVPDASDQRPYGPRPSVRAEAPRPAPAVERPSRHSETMEHAGPAERSPQAPERSPSGRSHRR
jgi:hypothetical protein